MNVLQAIGASKKYTKDTAISLGAVKGAPCTVKSIVKNGVENEVTFEWTSTTGTKQTSMMKVKDGENVDISADTGNAIVTKADGLFVAKGAVEISAESENALVTKADGLYVSTTSLKLSDGTTIEDAIDSLKAGQDESASDVPPIDFDTDW